MPFVERDADGNVKGTYAALQPGYAEEWVEDDHADLKARALADALLSAPRRIGDAAEAARLQFITPGSGKAISYQEKAKEAEALLADPDPKPGDYPLMEAEAGITAATAKDVATIVAAKYLAFKSIEAAISRTEAKAKQDAAKAQSAEEIEAIIAGLTWPKVG